MINIGVQNQPCSISHSQIAVYDGYHSCSPVLNIERGILKEGG